MLTIGQLAKQYSISRSTLIYYDSMGILKPSGRSNGNYRLYSDRDALRIEKIALFREAGLSLKAIIALLDQDQDNNTLSTALEERLSTINFEIQALRNQQKVILELIGSSKLQANTRMISKDTWVSLLESTGLDANGMKKWHIAFETSSPEAHQDFLESIGIETEEIHAIRHWSRRA